MGILSIAVSELEILFTNTSSTAVGSVSEREKMTVGDSESCGLRHCVSTSPMESNLPQC